jgi:hypothetical protein
VANSRYVPSLPPPSHCECLTNETLDLHKIYIDDEHYNSGHGHAYDKYGVDSNVGAVVIVRPDQCTSEYSSLHQRESDVLLMKRRRLESNNTRRLREYRGVLCGLYE